MVESTGGSTVGYPVYSIEGDLFISAENLSKLLDELQQFSGGVPFADVKGAMQKLGFGVELDYLGNMYVNLFDGSGVHLEDYFRVILPLARKGDYMAFKDEENNIWRYFSLPNGEFLEKSGRILYVWD
jgi:hypothetical protein